MQDGHHLEDHVANLGVWNEWGWEIPLVYLHWVSTGLHKLKEFLSIKQSKCKRYYRKIKSRQAYNMKGNTPLLAEKHLFFGGHPIVHL